MLETERLILRLMTEEDTDDLLYVFSDPKVMASFGGIVLNRVQMQKWVERNLEHQNTYGYGLFSIVNKADGILIGDCGLEQMEIAGRSEVEVGYDFRSEYWNQGFATEAASAVRDYALERLGYARLVSLIRSSNAASRRVAEKVGMTKERSIEREGLEYWLYAFSQSAA